MGRVVGFWSTIWLGPSDSQIRFYPVGFCNIELHKKTDPFSGSKVKIWSSESDRRRISLIVTSQCGGTASISYQTYRSVRYRFDVVPNLPKRPVPVSMLYRYRYQLRYKRSYRYRRYRCWCCTDLTEVSGAGIIIDVVPTLPKCPVPVHIDVVERTYLSVQYRYWWYTEVTAKYPVLVLMFRTSRSVRYR